MVISRLPFESMHLHTMVTGPCVFQLSLYFCSSIFLGTCCLLPVLGGWLADSVAGKFSVIFYSVIIYVVGTLLLLLGSISENDKHVEWAKTSLTTNKSFKRANFLYGLALVAFAMGGIKSNLVPLGAEQVSKNKRGEYFFWFYWFINIGAILAYTFVVYVQQSVSYFYGYLIPTCSIVITLVIFLSGKSSYFIRPPAASVLTRTVKILMEAVRKRPRLSHTGASVHWLDRAKQRFGGSYECCDVEDVKKVYRLIPIFTTFISFWMVCGQVGVWNLNHRTFYSLLIISSVIIITLFTTTTTIIHYYPASPSLSPQQHHYYHHHHLHHYHLCVIWSLVHVVWS